MNVQCDRCGTHQEVRDEHLSLPAQCQRCGHVFIPQAQAPEGSEDETIILQADDSDIFALSDSFERDERITQSPGPQSSVSLGDMLFLGADSPEPTNPQQAIPNMPGFQSSFDHSQHPDFDPTNPRSDALRLPGAPITRPFEQPPPQPSAPLAAARSLLSVPGPIEPAPIHIEPPPQPTKAGLLINALISLLALTALLAGLVRVVFDLEPPADRQRVEKLTDALTGQVPQQPVLPGLAVDNIQASIYPQPSGRELLVVFGQLSSSNPESNDNILVRTTLVDAEGRELGSASSPAGVVLTPFELAQLGPEVTIETIAATRSAVVAGQVAAFAKTGWMTVFESPPENPDTLSYRVAIERAEPREDAQPADPPEPGSEKLPGAPGAIEPPTTP